MKKTKPKTLSVIEISREFGRDPRTIRYWRIRGCPMGSVESIRGWLATREEARMGPRAERVRLARAQLKIAEMRLEKLQSQFTANDDLWRTCEMLQSFCREVLTQKFRDEYAHQAEGKTASELQALGENVADCICRIMHAGPPREFVEKWKAENPLPKATS